MKNEKIIILGAGVAGLAAAECLNQENLMASVYEQEKTYGGLCNSFLIKGFTFDTFAHISFDPNTEKWLEERTPYYTHMPEALNFDNGRWIRHPVQNNLYTLPVDERVELIKGFINRDSKMVPENYAQWLQKIYGKCFAEKYPYRYTRKYWTVDPERLEMNWAKGRLYEPDIEEVLFGAMTESTPGVHYSKEAHYPKKGGFKAFLKPMAENSHIVYNKRAKEIDMEEKMIFFYDGSIENYDRLITTIPLPELCSMIRRVPDYIKKAANKLEYTSGVMVSLGFNRPDISPALWYYIYDEDIFPARVYSPDWKSKNNVPEGYSAIQAEIYYSAYHPLKEPLEIVLEKSINQLLKLGLFQEKEIILKDIRMKKYANIMFTPEIYEARKQIHQYLDTKGVFYAGRFGEWDYLWVGQSLLSGRIAAEKCMKVMEIEK